MGTRAALVTGTAVSLAVTGLWSWSADLATGPAVAPRFSGSLRADYAALAAAPTGNGPELYAVLTVIFTLCLLASWLRARRQSLREAASDLDRAGACGEAA